MPNLLNSTAPCQRGPAAIGLGLVCPATSVPASSFPSLGDLATPAAGMTSPLDTEEPDPDEMSEDMHMDAIEASATGFLDAACPCCWRASRMRLCLELLRRRLHHLRMPRLCAAEVGDLCSPLE